jgi:hypothetical protein
MSSRLRRDGIAQEAFQPLLQALPEIEDMTQQNVFSSFRLLLGVQ